MRIEFDFKSEDIEILDYIVRDMDWYDDDDKHSKKPHLQARVKAKNKDLEGYHKCSVSYYDSNGQFLGLDDGSFHVSKNSDKLPAALSIPLNIPDNVQNTLVTISSESESNSLFEICVGLCILFGLAILGSWAYKSVFELFN